MSTMNMIEPMYLWSLDFFVSLYRRIINDFSHNNENNENPELLLEDLTFKIY